MYKDDLKKMFSVMSDIDIAKWVVYTTSGEGIVTQRYRHGELSLLSAVIGFIRQQAPDDERDFVLVREILSCCPSPKEFWDDPDFRTAADMLFSEIDDNNETVRDLYENPLRVILYRYKKYKWYDPEARNMIAVSCLDRIDQLAEKSLDSCCDLFMDTEGFQKNAGSFDFLNNSEYL